MTELRPEMQRFAEEMEKQLRANEHKGGWKECRFSYLIDEISRNYNQMVTCFVKNDTRVIAHCAVNVANFAMMIADNWGGLTGEAESIEVDPIGLYEQVQKLDAVLNKACEEIVEIDHCCPYEFHQLDWFECKECPKDKEDHYNDERDISCWKRYFMEEDMDE